MEMQSYKPLLFHVHIYTALTFELDFQKEFHFFFLNCKRNVHSKSFQSCLTLYDPMDCSPPGFSIRGVFHVKILECVVISFSMESF